MTNLPIINHSNEKYPGEMPDILSHRASVVSNGIHRILEAVPAAAPVAKEETQVLDSTMTDAQKRERIQNLKHFNAEADPMPQDVYIEALAAKTASETGISASLDTANTDLLGSAHAALRDIFGSGRDE